MRRRDVRRAATQLHLSMAARNGLHALALGVPHPSKCAPPLRSPEACVGFAGLLTKLRSQSLLAAWNTWRAFVPCQQMKKAGLQLAAGHWAHRELATAFDMFRWAPLEESPSAVSMLQAVLTGSFSHQVAQSSRPGGGTAICFSLHLQKQIDWKARHPMKLMA